MSYALSFAASHFNFKHFVCRYYSDFIKRRMDYLSYYGFVFERVKKGVSQSVRCLSAELNKGLWRWRGRVKRDGEWRRNIKLIESDAKCRHLKNLFGKGFCGRCLSVWCPLPSLVIVCGGLAILQVLNLVIYIVLNSCGMCSLTGLHTPTPSQPLTVSILGGFNVSNLMGFKRRMLDICKKITFYFLQNVWKCTVFRIWI